MPQFQMYSQVKPINGPPYGALRTVRTVSTVQGVKAVDTTTLRRDWGDRLHDAAEDAEAFAILNRGRPDAVLMSGDTWLYGCTKVPVPEANQTRIVSPEVRANLRGARDSARSGHHILIPKRYAGIHKDPEAAAAEIEAVIAPYDWARKALPELGEIVVDNSAQTRYRRGAGAPPAES